MAVSAFYGDRNGIKTNMYGQRNRHSASPPFGDVADRLIRIMAMPLGLLQNRVFCRGGNLPPAISRNYALNSSVLFRKAAGGW